MPTDPPPKSEITVVIPTLNEAEAIGAVIEELKSYGFERIIVVDGRSTDGTPEIAASKGATVVTQRGKGKADAIRTALDYVETPYMLVMDGDLTYDPAHIEKMLELAPLHDEVIGARVTGRENIPLVNRFGNWLLTKLFNVLFGTGLRDVCSGMYVLKTEVAREIRFESKGFSVEVEFAAHVASTTGRITEVDINYRPRVGK
ncbi:MAG TPA: glycosyltransferase, partial [Chromatiales bacterium]|nr:glycosyltransferase [Chromatiales bacterium]